VVFKPNAILFATGNWREHDTEMGFC
jgi:hypothetical protein